MPSFIAISGQPAPLPKITFHLDRVIDATLRKDGSYLLRNYDGKRMVSTDTSLPYFLDNGHGFLRMGNQGPWINADRVLVAITGPTPISLAKVRTRFADVTYPKGTVHHTPRLIEWAELTQINRSTWVRLTAASQITRAGVLTACNETYQVDAKFGGLDKVIRAVKALGWLKLKNGTFVNPLDFARMFQAAIGWIETEFGRSLNLSAFHPEDRLRVDTATPWVKIQLCLVNPNKILYLDPEHAVIQGSANNMNLNKVQFAMLKKLVDPRIVHPLQD